MGDVASPCPWTSSPLPSWGGSLTWWLCHMGPRRTVWPPPADSEALTSAWGRQKWLLGPH